MLRLPKPHLNLPIRRTGARERDELVLSRGQIIVVFAASLMVFIGIMGIAIDVSYAWVNEMRIQKAADAAALAGAVYLPDDPASATAASTMAAKQNGYVAVSGSVVVDAHQNNPNKEQMDVSITAPVPTFFMRAFGINSLTVTRVSHAQFHLPVPMGSPLNVFGDPTATDLDGNALNFWAAIQGPCTLKQNGDPYATKDTTTAHNPCSPASASNTEYKPPAGGDPGAYNYAVKVPSAGTLRIELYDPEFCYRNAQGQDTGDSQFTSNSKFSTVFTLYDPSDTPYDLTDDTVKAAKTYLGDQSTTAPNGSCSSTYVSGNSHDNYVGQWITFTSFAAQAGTYRLNIQTVHGDTTSPADGSNNFGIRATLNGGSGPEVYAGVVGAESAMSVWQNLASGTTHLYLANISSACAGKTMEVDLFDPGDLNGTGVMYFEMPVGAGYQDSQFSWRDSGTNLGSGGTLHSNVSSVTTASGGNSNFQGHWVVVTIHIPTNYTGGWWKIRYVITGGAAHDRTTWRVEIRDSPVHLVG
ncbi:MAG: pilus assembly protein TadG-related protein [Candidatus Limnocylindrales bacterium]|jgi:hypothetical protein